MGREYSVVLSMTLGRVKQSWRLNEWSATHSLLSGHSRRSALLPIDDDSKARDHFVLDRTKNVEDQPETMLCLETVVRNPILFLQK